jgi:conjugative relaxase-like TrwC/TraI family protein
VRRSGNDDATRNDKESRLLRITQADSAAGAVRYFENSLQVGDYYLGADKGIWHGLGAERLGLAGEVTREAFARLASNRLPDGSGQLPVRNDKDRRPGYDFCLSVPKSVSVYLAISGDPVAQQLVQDSVTATMSVVEQHVVTRDQRGGEDIDRKTGNLIYGMFHHSVTRPVDGYPDPHTHFHCWVPNASFCRETGRWQHIEFGELKTDGPYFESVFHADLGRRLLANGYAIRRTERDFELAGVPERLNMIYSKRSEQINREAKAKHSELAIEAAKVVERTGMDFETRLRKRKPSLEPRPGRPSPRKPSVQLSVERIGLAK